MPASCPKTEMARHKTNPADYIHPQHASTALEMHLTICSQFKLDDVEVYYIKLLF